MIQSDLAWKKMIKMSKMTKWPIFRGGGGQIATTLDKLDSTQSGKSNYTGFAVCVISYNYVVWHVIYTLVL